MKLLRRRQQSASSGARIPIGRAILEKDDISGSKRWITYGIGEKSKEICDPGEPIVLDPADLEVRTEVEIFIR